MKMQIHNLALTLIFLLLGSGFSFAHDKKEDDQLKREKEQTELEDKVEDESYRYGDEAQSIVNAVENYGDKVLVEISDHVHGTEAPLPPADAKIEPLTYTRDQRWWWTLFKERKLSMTDTTVVWPKFLKFCVDVYNWGDKTFNSYDPEYVIGTGKRWKARLVSDNWLDSYAMKFTGGFNSTMSSDVYANLGAYIQYMAVSVGYSYDIEKLFNHREPSHKKYEFGFICALFNAELYYHENKGGVYVRRFDIPNAVDIKNDKNIKEYFPGVDMTTLGFDAYYFFNNKRYSQGAAYNFAKYQLKSQGSFMLGLSLTNQKLTFDFSQLPENLKKDIPEEHLRTYYFHYNSYAVLAGYGYNWVLAPKLLFNVSVMPSVGFSHYYEDSLEGDKYLVSLNIQGRMSITYNLGNFYFGLIGKMNGHLYKQGRTSMFSSIENFAAYVGIRF